MDMAFDDNQKEAHPDFASEAACCANGSISR
jgi:hypothetical protein